MEYELKGTGKRKCVSVGIVNSIESWFFMKGKETT